MISLAKAFKPNLSIGTVEGQTLCLKTSERSENLHIVGVSGEGKTKLLEHMIRFDIANNNGLCLIDPHGALYDNIIKWCEERKFMDREEPKKIVLLDPAEDDWTFGFNPLGSAENERAFEKHTDATIAALSQVWGGEDLNNTPTLWRCLRMIISALIEKGLTLYEAQYLAFKLNEDENVRNNLLKDLKNDFTRRCWNQVNSFTSSKYAEEFGSTANRLTAFLTSRDIKTIIGQNKKTIDLKRAMDEGWIVLVNLSPKYMSESYAMLLGTLIINDFVQRAFQREADTSRPFYLYIDECSDFLNADIAKILDKTRKFGLFCILAHQHLGQLRDRGDKINTSVMADAKNKIVFGGVDTEKDADIWADKLFIDQYNAQIPKEILNKPVVVGYEKIILHSDGETDGISKGKSTGTTHTKGMTLSTTTGDGASVSQTFVLPDGLVLTGVDPSFEMKGESHNISNQVGEQESFSDIDIDSETLSHSRNKGRHEALKPILQILPSATLTPEEQKIEFKKKLVNLPKRNAYIKLSKRAAVHFQTFEINEIKTSPERIRAFKEKCFNAFDFFQKRVLAEQEIDERNKNLSLNLEKAPVIDNIKNIIDCEPEPIEAIESGTDEVITETRKSEKQPKKSAKKIKKDAPLDDSIWEVD